MIGDLTIDFHMGIDGISLLMVLLTTLLTSDRHALHLDSRERSGQGLHAVLPAAGNRHAGCVPFAQSGAFLHLLGIHPHPHVFPDRRLGRRTASVCVDQVLPVYHGRFDPHAAGHPVSGVDGPHL